MEEAAQPSLRLLTNSTEEVAESALQAQVEAACGGDAVAFRELFETYSPSIFRYACARLGDRGLAEDAAQSVFLVAWTKLGRFRYEHEGSFVAWLFGIARRVVAERARRERTLVATPLEGLGRATVGFDEAVVNRASVVDDLLRLPDLQREVLTLRFLVGLSLAEVALAVGKSEARVKELQHRALARLRAPKARGDMR